MQQLKDFAEAVLVALRGKWALHPLLLLILLPILFIAEAQYDYARVSAGSATPTLASVFAAEAVLLCGYAITFGIGKPNARAVVAVCSYLLAGAARAAVIISWTNSGIAAKVPPAQRLIQSMLFIFCVAVIIAVVLDRSANYRRARMRLARAQSELETTRARNQQQLDLERSRLNEATTSRLTPALAQICEQVATLPTGGSAAPRATALADSIARTNSDLVRPLSHEIAAVGTSPHPTVDEASDEGPPGGGRFWDRNLLREATIIAPLQPIATVIIATLIRLSIVLEVSRFWFLAVVSLAVLGLSLAVFRQLLRGRFVRWRTGTRTAVFLGFYLLAGILMLVPLAWTNPDVDLEVQLRWAVLQVVVVVSICVLLAISSAAVYRLRSNLAAQKAVIASLRWENHRLEDSTDYEQRRISRFIHTDVQGLLAIAAIKLRSFARTDLAADLDDARSATDRAYEQTLLLTDSTNSAPPAVELRAGLDALASAWGALLSITITASEADLDQLNEIPSVAEAIMNIATETIANAARHGSARQVDIEIRGDGTIVATDDGTGPRGEIVPGLTSQQLLRSGGQWSIRPGPQGGSIVRAKVPTGIPSVAPASGE